MRRAAQMILTCALMGSMSVTSYAAFGWNSGTAAAVQQQEPQSYVFKSGETEIRVGADADSLVTALGTPLRTFEQDSCAYQGKDKVYTYEGFELSVYPDGAKNRISDIYLAADSGLSTPEGIKIGSTKDEVQKTYGSNYTENWGVYKYTLGDSMLILYTTNGLVDSIEYQLLTTVK